MYFPIAGIEIAWYIPPLFSLSLSFFTSMAGLSGAFLIMPFQIEFLGYTSPSVSATNQFYNLIAIPSSLYRYYKEKRLLMPLALAILCGLIPGSITGTFIRSFLLTDQKDFRLFSFFIFLYLTFSMIKDYLRKDTKKTKPKDPYSLQIIESNKLSCTFSFDGNTYTYNARAMVFITAIIATIGTTYGIGGGAFLAPVVLSYFRLPVYITAAPLLILTLASSTISVTCSVIFAQFFPENGLMPDFLLGTLFGIGGLIGMSLGAIFQKYVPESSLKFLLIIVLFITTYIWIEPLLNF